jgi:hypothetical protein
MTDMTGPATILERLGGDRFITVTGSTNFVGSRNNLSFRLLPNKRNLRFIHIKLTPRDIYTVTPMDVFYTVTLLDSKGVVVETHKNVHGENLCDLFTAVTGIYTDA